MELLSLILFCAGVMVFASFVMATRIRLSAYIAAFRVQTLALVAIALLTAYEINEYSLVFFAVLMFFTKVILVPGVLMRSMKHVGVSERLHSYLRPAMLALSAGVLVFGSYVTASVYATDAFAFPILGATLSVMFIGVLLLVTRTGMVGQIIGLFTLENGIFLCGLTLTHGLPFLVEMGVLFDVLIGFVLMLSLSLRSHREHNTLATHPLETLTD